MKMQKSILLIIGIFLAAMNYLQAQIDYSALSIVTTGLNVPAQIVFDTAGNLFVANHSYASYSGPYTNTVAKIDAAGNKSVFVSGYMWPSGIAIDKQQNLYFTQNNASSNITKVTPSGSASNFASLPHMPGPVTLYDNSVASAFAIYTVSHWGMTGIVKTVVNGTFSVFDPGSFQGCEVSADGQYLYAITGAAANLLVRFNISAGTVENWVTIVQNFNGWAGTIGPDNKPYFVAQSIIDNTKRALFRVNGYNDVTEVVNNIPTASDFGDIVFKKNGNSYDLYVSQVLDGNRMDPASNRIIKYQNVITVPAPVSITITASANNVCSGSLVTFTAAPVNGGTAPQYQWKVNGINSGTNNPVFIHSPANNDAVTCILTSNAPGATGNPATSNVIQMAVVPLVPVSVSITASANPVCQGDTVQYTAHMVNAGSNAALQWYVNGVPVYGNNIINGLVAHYPFNGTLADATGNSQNAVQYGNVSWTTDRFGNPNSAYYIGGNPSGSDYLTVANSSALAIQNPFSISVWINKEVHGGWILNKGRDIINGYGIYDAGGNAQVVYAGNNGAYVTNTTVSLNQWHLYTCVFKGDSASFYLDGTLADKRLMANNSYISTSTDYPLAIGRHFTYCCYNPSPSYWSYPFKGKVDDVRLYNRSLSASEVWQLYTGFDSTFSYVPQNGDVVTCVLTATGTCLSNNPDTSNAVTMAVSQHPVPSLTGPGTICLGATNVVYNTEPGMTSYVWTVSAGGTITSGAGTNTINVAWNILGTQTVGVSYINSLGCAAAAPAVLTVMVNPMPAPVISGSPAMCVASGYYDYTTQPGMSSYTWSISPGGTILFGGGTNQVIVTWDVPGSQWVKVNYMNSSGCTASVPTQFNISVNPLPGAAGTVMGYVSVCAGAQGVNYSTAGITDAVTYVWSLPSGATIVSGAGTNSILVDFGAAAQPGDITVYGNNLCGNGTPSQPFHVNVAPLPGNAGTPTGEEVVCQGDTGVIYYVSPVQNAMFYVWEITGGGVITTGNGTNSVRAKFPVGPAVCDITVYASNSCGAGLISGARSVTVNSLPPVPVITQNGNELVSSAPAGNQWYYNGILIPGADQVTYTPDKSGEYHVIVTISDCGSEPSNRIYYLMTGANSPEPITVKVYPVPNDGFFQVYMNNLVTETVTLSVLNGLGQKIFELGGVELSGENRQTIDLRPVPAGVYTLVIESELQRIVRKVVVQR
ncbi:MAG: LamG-like jellyroll fold domain-containing protein [Bacteroidales bacterium]